MRAVIVSDGKKGHLNQSLALAELLGVGHPRVLTARPLRGLLEPLARLLSGVLSPRHYPTAWRRRVLRSCFGEEENLPASLQAEEAGVLVISAGTTAAVPALALAGGIHARTLHILRPSLVPARSFDALILPLHDVGGKLPRNVLTLPVALGPVAGEALEQSRAELCRRLGVAHLPVERFLALLLGGNSAHYAMEPEPIIHTVRQTVDFARGKGLRLLLTTSRRTPGSIEQALQALALAEADVCYCCVWGRSDAYNPVPAFLHLAGAVLVTEDSVSMASEAVLSGHQPLVHPLRPHGISRKLGRFHSYLYERGLAAPLRVEAPVAEEWERALAQPRRTRDEVHAALGLPELIERVRELVGL